MDPGRVDADVKTAPAPEAPARPAPGAVPSAEPLHGPVDTAEDSLDVLQTAFGALSVEEVVAQPAKRKRESEKDAGDGADEGEEQGQDPTDVPTSEGAPSASGLHASPSPITTTLPAAATSTSTTNPPTAEGTGCKVFVQPIFSLFSVYFPDICVQTEIGYLSTVLDSVGISQSGISVVLR